MTHVANKAVAILARRIVKDPTSATVEDARKLARAVLLMVEGKLP